MVNFHDIIAFSSQETNVDSSTATPYVTAYKDGIDFTTGEHKDG